jgi:hypothetical protein
MVEEPSHVKQLSLSHMCKIGLTYMLGRVLNAVGEDNIPESKTVTVVHVLK